MERKFYVCQHCGNIITKIYDSGVNVVCCGDEMTEMIANTVDASREKHVPVVNINDNMVNVRIGEQQHPMTEEHYIQWVWVQTDSGAQLVNLKPLEDPSSLVILQPNVVVEAVYIYCNLHGLWKADLQ